MNTLPGINLVWHSIRPQGGMDRHVLDLINGFSSRGIPMRVIARTVSWPGEQPAGVEFVVLPDRTPFQRFNNDRFEHKAMNYIKPEWPTIGISRVTGKVEMAISGGTHIAHLRNKGKRSPGFFDRKVIENESALYRQADVIVAHSEQTKNEIIQDYGIAPEKVRALYPSVDVSAFNLDARKKREQVRKAWGVPDDRFVLLFPSNDHERKGGQLILEAMKGLDDSVVLAVAGKSPLNAPGVLNLGFCEDMPSVYAAADATILASVYEPFGLVGPESILCGTPVLLADTIGAAEVLSEPGCFSFSRKADDLRKLIVRIMASHGAGGRGLEAPERFIHYPYSFDAYLDELIGLLALYKKTEL